MKEVEQSGIERFLDIFFMMIMIKKLCIIMDTNFGYLYIVDMTPTWIKSNFNVTRAERERKIQY